MKKIKILFIAFIFVGFNSVYSQNINSPQSSFQFIFDSGMMFGEVIDHQGQPAMGGIYQFKMSIGYSFSEILFLGVGYSHEFRSYSLNLSDPVNNDGLSSIFLDGRINMINRTFSPVYILNVGAYPGTNNVDSFTGSNIFIKNGIGIEAKTTNRLRFGLYSFFQISDALDGSHFDRGRSLIAKERFIGLNATMRFLLSPPRQ